MRTLRRFKKILPVFLLILQILFSFAPLTILIPTASAQEADPQPVQIDSQLKLDNYRGDFAVYYVVDGQIMAHQGTSDGNLDLFLGSVSGEDQIKHNPDRVVVKTEGQTYHLLLQQVENSYGDSNLDLSSADEDFLFNNWQIEDAVATTKEVVRSGITYTFPLNNLVQVRFNRLPENPSTLTIEEISLSADLQAELGAVSPVAYDVRTEMPDGEFNYDLILPKSETDEEVVVKYAESLAELEQEAQLVEANISVSEEQVKVENLDHMTVFVVVPADIVSGRISQYFKQGWRMTSFGNANIDLVNVADYEVPQQFGPHSIRMARSGGDGTNRSYLGYYQSNLRVSSLEEIAWSQYSKTGTDSYLNIFIRNNSFPWRTATIVYHPTRPTKQWTNHTLNADTTTNLYVRRNGEEHMSFSQLQSEYGDWYIENHIDSWTGLGGIVFVSGSTSPKDAQEHFIDNVSIDLINQEPKNFDFVQYVPVVTTPEQIGYNINDGSLISQTPTRYGCSGGVTNVNDVSVHWNDVSNGDLNIKYQRQFSKDNANWTGNEIYTNPYTDYRSFGYGEVKHYSRVRSFYDSNNNGQYDAEEPVSGWSNVCDITYDKTKPDAPNLISPSSGAFVSGNPTQTWSKVNDAVNYIYESYSDEDLENSIYRTTINNNQRTVGGTQTIDFWWRVKAVDAAGNESDWSTAWLLHLDNTSPIVEITNPLAGGLVAGIVNIRGFVTDTNLSHYNVAIYKGGVDVHDFSLRLEDQTIYSSEFSEKDIYSWNTNNYPDGEYQIRLAARDKADNRELNGVSEDVINITVDNTAPEFTIDGIKYDNGSVVNKFVTNDNTPTIVGRALSSDMVSIDLTVNGHTYSTSVTTGSWEVKITDIIPDDTYQMELIATDAAGNSKSTWKDLTVDTVAPTAIHTYYKNGQAILGDAEVYAQSTNQLSFTGEYTDASPSSGLYWDSFVIFEAQDDGSFSFSANGKKAYCSWREQPNLVNLSGSNFSLTEQISFANCEADLEDGVYYLAHHIYDSATRKDIPSINQFRDVLGLKFNIDATAPSSNISNPNGNTYHSGPILIEGNTSDSNGVVSVKLSSAPYENESCGEYAEITTLNLDPVLTSYDWTYSWTPSSEGQYCIKAQGLDVADNLEQTSVVKNVIYDKTIPEVDLTVTPTDPDGSGNWYITRPEVTLTDSDNFAVDYIQYRWGTTGSWNTYSTPLLLPAEGTNTLYYRAVDRAGNLSEEGIKTLQWDQTELTEGPLNIKADPNPTADSSSTISWDDATDNIGINKYQITWDLRDGDDKHSKEVAGDVTETEINELKEGSYKITVTAYDGSGYNRSASTTLVVDRTAPVAPSLTLTASRAGEVDLSWTTVADADRYIIYYGLEAGNYLYAADVGNVTNYTVQGLTAGNYYFVVRAVDESDNQGANSNEVSILALTGAPAGTIVAEGFTEAGVVQGETTEASAEEQAAMNEEIAKQGEVKGAAITCTNLSKSLFWIFLVVQAVIMLLLAKFSKRAWLKLLAFLLLPALFTVIIKRMGLANCFSNETMIWLSNNYYLPAYLAAMLTKILELLLITD